MNYMDDVVDLERDDPAAAIKVAKKAATAGTLTKQNAEQLIMLQTDEKDRQTVRAALAKLFEDE